MCALNGKYSSFKRKIPEGESPLCVPEETGKTLASRKVVYREVRTEVSETAKVGTDE